MRFLSVGASIVALEQAVANEMWATTSSLSVLANLLGRLS